MLNYMILLIIIIFHPFLFINNLFLFIMTNLIYINTLSQLQHLINSNNIIIIKITANWCISCNNIRMLYKQLADFNTNNNIIFTEININYINDELLDFLNITTLPTFLFYSNNTLLHYIISSDKLVISRYINNLIYI